MAEDIFTSRGMLAAVLKKGAPQLVILAWMIPEMNGRELAENQLSH